MKVPFHTDPDLLKRLEEAAGRPMSREEVQRQRVSFIFGNMPKESTITKHQIEQVLARGDGDKAVA